MIKFSRAVVLFFFLIGGAVGIASADSLYNFENTGLLETPFAVTSNGLTATFSSSGDPEGFEVIPTVGLFSSLTGNGLGNFNAVPFSLSIAFSSDASSISLDFATSGPAFFTLSTLKDGMPVNSVMVSGTVPGGFQFPEGAVGLSGGTFNEVLMTSTASSFTVDNIDVTPVATPEAGSLFLLGFGLAATMALRRREFGS
jgi:hypothetical protein